MRETPGGGSPHLGRYGAYLSPRPFSPARRSKICTVPGNGCRAGRRPLLLGWRDMIPPDPRPARPRAVLLVNLGSPDSPAVRDVRRYLREFLGDERVLDLP